MHDLVAGTRIDRNPTDLVEVRRPNDQRGPPTSPPQKSQG
jgi:hypothetical protein